MQIDNKILLIPADEADDLGAILNCAVRYCIGRTSYMPRLVMDYIRKHPELLNPKTVGTMIRDIRQARDEPQSEIEKKYNHTALGVEYQRDYWLNFLKWLEEQEAKMNEQ
jgi:hypothetical protein